MANFRHDYANIDMKIPYIGLFSGFLIAIPPGNH